MRVAIALGSNVGDRLDYLRRAARKMEQQGKTPIHKSLVYESRPLDCPPGSQNFLNAIVVAEVDEETSPVEFLRELKKIEAKLGPPGFIGPVGADVPVLKDAAIQGEGFFAGANKPDAHLIGITPGRDFSFQELDIRSVEAGDTAPGGGTIEIEPAIEIGNIFKLGTRYSEALGATYLDEHGEERPIVMGSYLAWGMGKFRAARSPLRCRHRGGSASAAPTTNAISAGSPA